MEELDILKINDDDDDDDDDSGDDGNDDDDDDIHCKFKWLNCNLEIKTFLSFTEPSSVLIISVIVSILGIFIVVLLIFIIYRYVM